MCVVFVCREKHGILVTAEDYLCVKAIEKLVQEGEEEGAAVAKEVVQLLEEWVRVVRDTPGERRGGQTTVAAALVITMLTFTMTPPLLPGVRAVNKALEVLSQRGQWDVCLSLLRGGMFRRFHAHPDCASYSTVMHAMARSATGTDMPTLWSATHPTSQAPAQTHLPTLSSLPPSPSLVTSHPPAPHALPFLPSAPAFQPHLHPPPSLLPDLLTLCPHSCAALTWPRRTPAARLRSSCWTR